MLPPRAIVPDCGPVMVDVTGPSAAISTVSKPPAPPSTVPLSDPPGAKTNVSLLSAAPVRFSKPAKETLPTEPPPAPVTCHMLSAGGPSSVSIPPPPSKLTGSEIAPIVKESLPAPLVTERLLTSASGRLLETPSTVTERFVASAATEIVCADPSKRTMIHGAGAGGDRPLAVLAFGSGASEGAFAGAAGSAEGSAALELVVPVPEEPDGEEPAALVAPAPARLLSSWVVAAESDEPVEEVAVTCVGSPEAGALTEVVPPVVSLVVTAAAVGALVVEPPAVAVTSL